MTHIPDLVTYLAQNAVLAHKVTGKCPVIQDHFMSDLHFLTSDLLYHQGKHSHLVINCQNSFLAKCFLAAEWYFNNFLLYFCKHVIYNTIHVIKVNDQ